MIAFLAAAILIMAAPRSALALQPLSQVETSVSLPDGRPAILLFWRSDCTPCMAELANLADYRRAAGHTRLIAVALEPKSQAQAALARKGMPVDGLFAVDGDANGLLTRAGGAPPRLPLAVRVDGRGAVTRRHHGLLGTDLVSAWAK